METMDKATAEKFLTIIFNNEWKIREIMSESVNNDFAHVSNGDITTERFAESIGRLMRVLGGMDEQLFLEWETINVTLPALINISRNAFGVESFEVFNEDARDFHDCATWAIESALFAAFNLGRTAGRAGK